MQTLLCIELPRQIDPALNGMQRAGIADYQLLALTPHMEYSLEKRGIGHLRPEDYHSELVSILREEYQSQSG